MAATYPKTGSILDSTTRTALSTQIIIMVNNEPVGAVQEFRINQSIPIKRINEVGLDGTVELVPDQPTQLNASLTRIVYDGLEIAEAMSRGYRNIQAQRIPFDVVIIDQYTGTGNDAVITTLHNCWFKSIGVSYSAGNYVITQNADIEVEAISTTRGGEAVALSQGVGGSRQIPGIQTDDVELQADSGVRRGSLDAEGLISAAY